MLKKMYWKYKKMDKKVNTSIFIYTLKTKKYIHASK